MIYSPGTSQSGYYVYRFENSPTDTTDPDPGTYSDPSEVIGTGLDPTSDGDPDSIGFKISTQDLVDDSSDASKIVAIQFNILTMNKTALNGADVSSRSFDALGDQRTTTDFDSPRTISILTSGRYDNTGADGGQKAAITEPGNDVYNAPNNQFPAIDITDYYVDVAPP